MSELLNDEQVTEALSGLGGWHQDGASIVREVELESFSQAIQVVNRIAEIAENNDHHPDIDIRWRTLAFRCATHSEGGITAKDVSLAQQIDATVDAIRAT